MNYQYLQHKHQQTVVSGGCSGKFQLHNYGRSPKIRHSVNSPTKTLKPNM